MNIGFFRLFTLYFFTKKSEYIPNKLPFKLCVNTLGISIKSMFTSFLNLSGCRWLLRSAIINHVIHTIGKGPAQGALYIYKKFYTASFVLNIQVLFGVNIINMFKASYCFQYKFLYIVFCVVLVLIFFFYCNKSNFHCFDFVCCFGSKFAMLINWVFRYFKHSTKNALSW